MTFEDIINDIYAKDSIYQEILHNIADDELECDLLLSEFSLYACNNPQKVVDSYNKKYLKYLFITVIKNQKHSST